MPCNIPYDEQDASLLHHFSAFFLLLSWFPFDIFSSSLSLFVCLFLYKSTAVFLSCSTPCHINFLSYLFYSYVVFRSISLWSPAAESSSSAGHLTPSLCSFSLCPQPHILCCPCSLTTPSSCRRDNYDQPRSLSFMPLNYNKWESECPPNCVPHTTFGSCEIFHRKKGTLNICYPVSRLWCNFYIIIQSTHKFHLNSVNLSPPNIFVTESVHVEFVTTETYLSSHICLYTYILYLLCI